MPAQLQLMRDYAHQHDWMVVEEFLEPGASAKTADRPALQQLLAKVRDSSVKIDVVLVHKIDRLARSVYDHATIRALLQQRGIRLASVVENVDDSISGQLVENIMASIAQFYSANLGEEVKKGMRVMIQRGEWPHLPPRGYLQSRTADNRPLAVPDEAVAPAIAEAFELYATGRFSLRDIGEELLIRGVTTGAGRPLPLSYVRDMLENPFYAGRFRWNGAEYPAKHVPVVSEALFLRVQQVLRHRFKTPGERGRARYLLRGLATCGECGYRMTAERHKRWAYYRCIQNAHGRCHAGFSNVTPTHGALLALYRRLHLPETLKSVIHAAALAECERRSARAKQSDQALRRRRERLLAREIKLTEAFTAGDTSTEAYRALTGKIRADIAAVDAALQEQRLSATDLMAKVDRLLEAASSLSDLHGSLDLVKQQQLLALVFARLTLDRGDIVDYALRPPFEGLLQAGAPSDIDPPAGLSSHLEQRTATPAIQSLFEFDFSALEGLLPAVMSTGKQRVPPEAPHLDSAP